VITNFSVVFVAMSIVLMYEHGIVDVIRVMNNAACFVAVDGLDLEGEMETIVLNIDFMVQAVFAVDFVVQDTRVPSPAENHDLTHSIADYEQVHNQ